MSFQKKLGILGGMGPEATILMFQKIVSLTPAEKDQDHLEIFIHNNTKIPDRTDAILHGGASPLESLCHSAELLSRIGADVIIIPCMTSHFYIDQILEKIHIPIINAVEESVLFIRNIYPDVKNVGILSSTGTMKSGLFQKELSKESMTPIVLSMDLQDALVMDSIYGKKGIKAGYKDDNVKEKLIKATKSLISQGAECIIAGCTEIPLALKKEDIFLPLIDPMDVLAKKAIEECMGDT